MTGAPAPDLRAALAEADALAGAGHVAAAGHAYREVAARARSVGDLAREAMAWLGLAHLADDAGSLQPAHDHARAGLRAAQADPSGASAAVEGALRLHLARLYAGLGDRATAARELDAFDALPADVQAIPPLAWSAAMLRGEQAAADGDLVQARQHAAQALRAAQATGDARALAEARSLQHGLSTHGPDAAHDAYAARRATAQALVDATRHTPGMARAGHLLELGLAWAEGPGNDPARARAAFDAALAHGSAARQQWSGPGRHHLMERVSAGVQRIVAWHAARGDWAAAFAASEHAQGRALLDAMAASRGRPPPPAAQLAEVRAALFASRAAMLKFFRAEGRLLGWWLPVEGEPLGWDASAALPAVAALTDALLALNLPEALARPSRQGGEVPDWRGAAEAAFDDPATWPRLQSLLADVGTALFPPEVARALSPGTGAGRPLVVVPHLHLYLLPWSALPANGAAGPLLGERWAVQLAPSAGAWSLDAARPPARGPALVVADCGPQRVTLRLVDDDPSTASHWRFGELRGARAEGREVHRRVGGTLLEGPAATLAAVRDRLPSARLAHFATHGLWHPLGELSFLLLAGTDTDDEGRGHGANALLGRELEQGPLAADLVVLSACQSGLGGLHLDSPLGLGPSLLAGGARTVLLALWPLDDRATLRFMQRFHDALVQGATPPEALARVQAGFRTGPAAQDGLLWAGFVVLGSHAGAGGEPRAAAADAA